jgi:hypothetical protein
MYADGMSYLDVGDAYFRGDWAAAINGYWSPMYSWWLGLVLYLLRPSIWWESVTVHLVNLVIYVGALFSFRFFIHSVLHKIPEEAESLDGSVPLPKRIVLTFGYSIFLWASLVLIDPGNVSPDLLLAVIGFLIAGCLVELRSNETYGKFAMFGVLSGAAYLGKAVMFPVGVGFLPILLLSGRVSRRRVYGVLLSALLFAIMCLPFVAALSKAKERFTFGDSGRLNYASMVSPNSEQIHWQGAPTGSGAPKHATRQLLDHPAVFEFAEPVGGTYPPWYDPSYWNEGVRGTFRLRSQIRVLVQSALNYTRLLTSQLGLLAGVLTLVLWGGAPTRRAIVSNWPLIAAGGLSIGIYALVLVRTRYVGASVVLVLIAILAGIRLPKSEQSPRLVKYLTAVVMATLLFSVVAHLAETAYTTMTVYSIPTPKDQMETAKALQNLGLHAGDRVAVIGEGMFAFWARLGRFKISSEIFSPEIGNRLFWSESLERRKLAYKCLSRTGAKVVVVWNPPPDGMDPGWKQISSTNFYMRFLDN